MNELRLKQIISEELTKTDQNKIGVMIRKEIKDAFGSDLEKKVLKVLEKELTKWDNVDISIKDRIKVSEFNKYIEQAMSIADKRM